MSDRPNRSRSRSKMTRKRSSAPATRKNHHGEASRLNLALIPITIIAGIVSWLIGQVFYAAFIDVMPRPVLIGCLFFMLGLILSAVVFVYSNAAGIFEENVLTGNQSIGGVIGMMAGGLALVFCTGALFQWIYGLDFTGKNPAPTSYIFVIDDSGSMEDSDPANERFAAIATVLDGMDEDFPYIVYGFANEVEIIKSMAPISEGIPNMSGYSSGGTAIKAALVRVIDDYESGVWDGGKSPKVILLTDGYAGDIDSFRSISNVLERYTAANISVSTVGLGDVDNALMEGISEATGGVFIDVSDASELSGAMGSAARQHTDRDLVSVRYTGGKNILYGVLRVVFLTLLGSFIGIIAAAAYGNPDSTSFTTISSIIQSFAGGLLMEIGTDVGISDKLMWLLLWILIAATLGNHFVSRAAPQRTSDHRHQPKNRNRSYRTVSHP